MKIIYHCYGGSHSSVTAAAIHLGMLPETRLPCKRELLSLPYYDAQVKEDHGRIRFMGYDEKGRQIYISSKNNLGESYERIMRQLLSVISKEPAPAVAFVNTMPYVNVWMMLGGFLSRRWGWNHLGRTIIIAGTRQSYYRFVHLVEQLKKNNF